jgi:hypothetical protein
LRWTSAASPGAAGTSETRLLTDAHHTNDGTFTPFPSFDAYVTAGARKAFTWYWQVGDREGTALLDRLLATSVDPGTPPGELVTMLEARGAGPAEARALVDWLGEDVVVLLPA